MTGPQQVSPFGPTRGWFPPGPTGTPQTPAGAPGSIVPPAQAHTVSFTSPFPQGALGPDNFASRYAPSPAPQGAPWAGLLNSLTTTALNAAGSMLPGVNGKPAGIQVPGGQGDGGGGMGQPMGATGLAVSGGVTHSYNAPVDMSTNYHIAPATDRDTISSVQHHQNSQRDNAALASAPGMLASYP